ncbi:MAG: hypothetical protein ACI4QZ_09005 [Eubacteriales bacterium]
MKKVLRQAKKSRFRAYQRGRKICFSAKKHFAKTVFLHSNLKLPTFSPKYKSRGDFCAKFTVISEHFFPKETFGNYFLPDCPITRHSSLRNNSLIFCALSTILSQKFLHMRKIDKNATNVAS